MNMDRSMILGGTMATVMLSAGALAQNDLGELLDAGGKKMSKEEIVKVFSGAHSTGKTATGAHGEFEFGADGTYSGVVQSTAGGSAGVMGKWTATDGGKLCVEWTPVGRGANKGGGCGFYYSLGGDYYLTDSDSDRSVIVLKRTLKK
jgi:hypothetical protein